MRRASSVVGTGQAIDPIVGRCGVVVVVHAGVIRWPGGIVERRWWECMDTTEEVLLQIISVTIWTMERNAPGSAESRAAIETKPWRLHGGAHTIPAPDRRTSPRRGTLVPNNPTLSSSERERQAGERTFAPDRRSRLGRGYPGDDEGPAGEARDDERA